MIYDDDNTYDDNKYVEQPPKIKLNSTQYILFTTVLVFTYITHSSLAFISALDG